MPLHPLARDTVDAYLEAADAEAPALVEGLYLVGSAALDEFRPRTSDIDFVAITARRPNADDVAALARAHAHVCRRWPRPFLDGLYVTRDDLARDPDLTRDAPHSLDGRFYPRGGEGNPVTWHTLARCGVACRGPAVSTLTIAADPERLAAWTLANLDEYWRPLLARAKGVDAWRLGSLTPWGTVWLVLGATRLHYTLATGAIGSKEQAGQYALATFPERWHRVIDESLRIRRADWATPDLNGALRGLGEFLRPLDAAAPTMYSTPFERRRDALAYADMVIDDARRRFGAA